ncbi:MAG: glycosyltransferase family 4 protein [Acidobacteriaceae bacterium]|nr:glycosyltransferase family 4 protein [Acidobacteriaceae bacterium]MBV9779060.1 glycosyltransferase family 4 protein [Acidobacteriaceae bacterium]
MKILFVADNFPPERNAQASRVYERACYWQRWGHEVTVITCFPNFPEGKIYSGYKNEIRSVSTLDGIRVVRVKTFIAANIGKLLRIVDFLSYMYSAMFFGLFEKRPDVVVATSPQFFAAIAGWWLSLVHRVPFVMELSDLWPDSIVAVGAMKKRLALHLLEKIELFLYRRAKRIVVLTYAFKRNLVSRGIDTEKIDVVINGVDLSRYAPQPRDPSLAKEFGIVPEHFVVGYIGTLGMAHGLSNVLEAARQTTDPRIRFLLVGPGAERDRLISDARQLRLTNVIIAPAQPKERMPAVWSLCDVALVHLKNAELFRTVIPSKIFEAMAMRLPILLASPKGEATEIVERESCGIIVSPENPKELAAVALALANDRTKVHELATRSLQAAPKYSRERQAREMLLSLQKAVSRLGRQHFLHTYEPTSNR